jgi:pyridoxamine 5'-phosphate oxidase
MMQVMERLDLRAMRRDYAAPPLLEADLADTWLEQFERWLGEAVGEVDEPNAMILATADPRGRPSARTILLKAVDERGFVFFTNLQSRKGRELEANPRAALVFPWLDVRRQVVAEGAVEALPEPESDAYFSSRPRGAQIGALASPQSEVIDSRAALEELRAVAEAEHPASRPVPRPAYWGGLRVVPDTVEFWQGRADRLHDRLRYRRVERGAWVVERLAP